MPHLLRLPDPAVFRLAPYEVLAIEPGPRTTWPTWQITVRYADGQSLEHCTGWDPRRDTVVDQPDIGLS